MPVVGSGLISLQSLATEFGGSTPHSLSEYYRIGGLVPRTETSVPTSGLISLSQFYGTERVNAGSSTYTSPGTYYLTVPAHNQIYMQAWGAGGGGGGSWYDIGPTPGTAGGTGGDSYVSIPTYGTMYGFGGGGGPTWLAGSASNGGASSGNTANTAGGGIGGGAGGVYGASFGATGGTGGYSYSVFTFGVTSGAPGQGVTLTIVVGQGGAGGFGQVNGSAGGNGQVVVGWS